MGGTGPARLARSIVRVGAGAAALAVVAGAGPARAQEPAAATGDSVAAALVRGALDALGGAGAIERAGGIVLEGEGTHDLSVRLQGMRPDLPEAVPLVERLAVDPAGGRVAYEARGRVNPDAEEWLRYTFDGTDLVVLDLLGRVAYRDAGGGTADARARYARAVPHLLLEEALRDPARLRHRGRGAAGDAVAWTLAGGEVVTLLLDPESRRLTGLEYQLDMPVTGDTRVRWTFHPYVPVERLGPYPSGYTVELDGRPLRTVRYTRVRAGAREAELFAAPRGIAVPPPAPPPAAAADAAASAPPRPAVRELADGVFLAPNVRSGFHVLFVEFGDFVLVVDAPAGWHELQEVPAAPLEGGSGAVGERLLRIVRQAVPHKPVRYLALTHHHGDHAGGVRPFAAAGATILGTEPTRRVVEAAVHAARLPGAGAAAGRPLTTRFETVRGERVVRDAGMEVRIVDVGPNPHAEGMLVAWLPRQRILYVSDLFEPRSERFFPSAGRVPVMRWFVDWLDRSGLEPETIYAIHGTARVTREQLDAIRALPPMDEGR